MDTPSQNYTGHQCEFVEQVSEEFKCKKCFLVARDLSFTVCCGQHYCQVCISPFQEGSKPCPGCGQEGFTVVPHVGYRKSILALEVYCLMNGYGCEWTGELQRLYTHLKNDCTLADSHPIPCPNGCTITSQPITKITLETHLKMCPYQEVECEAIGCGERIKHKDATGHINEHMPLMAAVQKKGIKSRKKLSRVVEDLEKRLKSLEDKVCSYPMIPPVHITLQGFDEKKAANECWESPPFYTHLGGYKLCLRIWPNGKATYTDAVTVKLYSKKGENDAILKWPAKFSITLLLLNQQHDQDHYQAEQNFEWREPTEETCEVGVFPGPKIKPYLNAFIYHYILEKTEYKKNDCLQFKVTKICQRT